MTRAIFALALAVSCLRAAPSRAEGEEDERPLGRHKVGNLWYTARFQLRDAGVDLNVFHTFRDPTKDAVVIIGPRIEGVLPSGRLRLTGMAFLETTYYRREGEERSTDFGGQGKADLDFRSVSLFGGGGGGQFSDRLSIDVDERLTRQEKRGNIGATVRFAGRFSVTGQASGEILDFQSGVFRNGGNIKAALDRNSVVVGGQLRIGIKRRTGFIASAEAVEDKFVTQLGELPRTHRSYRYLGGVEVRESSSRRLPFGRVMIGVREYPGTLAERSPFYKGPAAAAEVELPLGKALRLSGVAARDVFFASSVVVSRDRRDLRYRNAYVYKRYAGRATIALPAELNLSASGGFEEANYLLPYPYPDADSTVFFGRLDHRWTASLAMSRQFGPTLRIGGHVSWVRRVSSLVIYGYEDTRYGINAEVTP